MPEFEYKPKVDYDYKKVGGLTYSVPIDPKPRKKAPPLVVVMNESCTSCSGSPACQQECPVDCIHMIYDEDRPVRVYVDNEVCIGCMNCLSRDVRPKDVNKGDVDANIARINATDLFQKAGICPWDAIEIHKFDEGEARSHNFYEQPRQVEGDPEPAPSAAK